MVLLFHTEEWTYDYYTSTIIHETGHAYDFTLRYNYDSQIYTGISAIDDPQYNESLFTANNNTYSWKDLIGKDASNMLTAGGNQFSLYTLENFENSHTEYFAEVFKEYYTSEDRRERLKFIAPDTYNAMENLINNTIKGVN